MKDVGKNAGLLTLKLIGSLEAVDRRGVNVLPKSRKTAAILAYLSLNAGRWVPRTRLTRLLWDRVADEQGRASLRQALFELRKCLGRDYPLIIEAERDRIRLIAGAVLTEELTPPGPETAASKAGMLITGPTIDVFSSSLLLDALDGITDEFDQWLSIERQHMEQRLRGESEIVIGRSSGEGFQDRLNAARRAVSLDPTNEQAVRHLMKTLLESGQRAQALVEYQRCANLLRAQLDVEPDPETKRLYLELKRSQKSTFAESSSTQLEVGASQEGHPASDHGDSVEKSTRGQLINLVPCVAVLPFATIPRSNTAQDWGDVIADEMIRTLSHSTHLDVISRLSAVAANSIGASVISVMASLKAHYVISGSVRSEADQIVLDIELADTRSQRILWNDRLKTAARSVLVGEKELINQCVTAVSRSILQHESRLIQCNSLSSLDDSSLLLASIGLMHRNSQRDFASAHRLLEAVLAKHPDHALPNAWLANWHVLRVQQGWSSDERRDAEAALKYSQIASDSDPYCSLALTVDGFVHTNLLKQLDVGLQRYDLAIDANHNDPLAWLLRGTLHAFTGAGDVALENTQRALKLAPLDPHRYYYDSLAATACLAAGQYDDALKHAEQSLRANRAKTSTLRAKAVALWRLGREQAGREAIAELRRLEPDLTVSRWLRRSPSADYSIGKEWARAFRELGLPD